MVASLRGNKRKLYSRRTEAISSLPAGKPQHEGSRQKASRRAGAGERIINLQHWKRSHMKK